MKRFNEFMNMIKEDVDVATIKKMTEDQFKELLKRSTASRRNQLNAMRQSNSMRIKPQAQPPRVAPKLPTSPPPSAATSTTRPSLLKRALPGAGKIGAYVALDTAAEVGISKIKDAAETADVGVGQGDLWGTGAGEAGRIEDASQRTGGAPERR